MFSLAKAENMKTGAETQEDNKPAATQTLSPLWRHLVNCSGGGSESGGQSQFSFSGRSYRRPENLLLLSCYK